ncbi:23075_t:CDS:2, partial [Gigaspora margarita]
SHSALEVPAFSDNINNNRDQKPEDNELGSEYKNDENFISKNSENDEISNSGGNEDDQFNSQSCGKTCRRTSKSTRRSTHESTYRSTCGSTSGSTSGSTRERTYGRPQQNNTSNKFKLTNIKLHYLSPNTTAHLQPLDAGIISEVEMEITNQESESDFLDDEIAEIIVDLLSSNDSESSNIAQTMERYIQIVDKPVATEGMLDDKEVVTMVQAEENE